MAVAENEVEGKLKYMSLKTDDVQIETDGDPNKLVVKKDIYPATPVLTNVQDEDYSSNYLKRGHCLIFNQRSFSHSLQMNDRTGTENDKKQVQSLFETLGFQVEVCENFTVKNIKEKINVYAYDVDHMNCDCFALFFMSHGEDGKLYGYDTIFKADDLFTNFTADNCPGLAGKPKMFFIQACRGDKLDTGTELIPIKSTDQTDNGHWSMYKVPNHADFLISWSTVPGHYSWRNTSNGSWFMQSIVKVFTKYANYLDVLSMMTHVNRYMSIHFESNCPSNRDMHEKKQSAYIVSTLIRRIYLKPKK